MRCTHKMAEAVDDASPVPAEAMEDEQGVAEGGGEQGERQGRPRGLAAVSTLA